MSNIDTLWNFNGTYYDSFENNKHYIKKEINSVVFYNQIVRLNNFGVDSIVNPFNESNFFEGKKTFELKYLNKGIKNDISNVELICYEPDTIILIDNYYCFQYRYFVTECKIDSKLLSYDYLIETVAQQKLKSKEYLKIAFLPIVFFPVYIEEYVWGNGLCRTRYKITKLEIRGMSASHN